MSNKDKKINALLVNPWIVDFKAFDLWMKPLGILYISSILKQNSINTTLIDCMDRNHHSFDGVKKIRPNMTGKFASVEIEKPKVYSRIPRRYKRYGISVDAFLKELDSIPAPDIILVTSFMSFWYPAPHLVIELLKKRFPGVPVILGGVYPALCYDFAVKNSGADYIVKGSDFKKLSDIISETTGKEFGHIPCSFPDFPRADFSHYRELDFACIMTSAGCPFHCTYCASNKLQPQFIMRNPDDVVDEMKRLFSERQIQHFAFYDDALLVKREEHIIPILERLIEEIPGITLHTPNGLHARFIDMKTAQLMKKAGVDTIRLSLETIDPVTLSQTGSKVKAEDAENAVEALLSAGFEPEQIGLYIIMGVPGQSFDEVDRTIDYVYNLGVHSRMSMYSPVPGTEDFKKSASDNPQILTEPLYHNNAYQLYCGDWLDVEKKEYLKQKVNRLNKQCVKGRI